jgi:hypothetical protein
MDRSQALNISIKIVLLLLMPIALGAAGLGFLQPDLFADTENRELERLFKEMGVLQIPPADQPFRIQG